MVNCMLCVFYHNKENINLYSQGVYVLTQNEAEIEVGHKRTLLQVGHQFNIY